MFLLEVSLGNMIAIGGVVVGVIAVVTIVVERSTRLRGWGKDLGMKRHGDTWIGECNGSDVQIAFNETGTEQIKKSIEKNHLIHITAAASIVGPLPQGLQIVGARFRGAMPGEPFKTGDPDFDGVFQISAIETDAAIRMMKVPGLRNVMLNLVSMHPDLKVVKGVVHLSVAMQQTTADDPRPYLDNAFNTITLAAQCLAWGAFGEPIDNEYAHSRPEQARQKQPLTLPTRKAGREI